MTALSSAKLAAMAMFGVAVVGVGVAIYSASQEVCVYCVVVHFLFVSSV